MMTKEELESILELVNRQHHARGYKALSSKDSGVAIAALIAADASDRQTDALSEIASAIRELAEGGVNVDVDIDTSAIAEALSEVNVEIKDLVEISNSISNMATGIENLDITNTINIGETAKKLQVTAKELERTAKKLEATERGR